MFDYNDYDEGSRMKKPTKQLQGFQGLTVYPELFIDLKEGEITAIEFTVYLVIDSLNGKDGCYASNAYLAEQCNFSERSIREYIRILKKKGYLIEEKAKHCMSGRILRTYYRELDKIEKRKKLKNGKKKV